MGANQKIRRYAAARGVRLWQIAQRMGILDCSLSRKMRNELPEAEQSAIMQMIDDISREAMRQCGK